MAKAIKVGPGVYVQFKDIKKINAYQGMFNTGNWHVSIGLNDGTSMNVVVKTQEEAYETADAIGAQWLEFLETNKDSTGGSNSVASSITGMFAKSSLAIIAALALATPAAAQVPANCTNGTCPRPLPTAPYAAPRVEYLTQPSSCPQGGGATVVTYGNGFGVRSCPQQRPARPRLFGWAKPRMF